MIEIILASKLAWGCWILSTPAVFAFVYAKLTRRGYYAWDAFLLWSLIGVVFGGIGAVATIWNMVLGDSTRYAMISLSLNASSLFLGGYDFKKYASASE